jgi:hypothetical protein
MHTEWVELLTEILLIIILIYENISTKLTNYEHLKSPGPVSDTSFR